jgi:hypothetical protein
MLPLGNDAEAALYDVVELRIAAEMPLVPDGPSVLQYWGYRFARGPMGGRWYPYQYVRYTKIERGQSTETAYAPM